MKRIVSIIFISTLIVLGCVTFVNGVRGVSFTTLQYPKIRHNDQTVMVDTLWNSVAENPIVIESAQSEHKRRTFFERVRLLINHLNCYTKEWAAFGMLYVEQFGLTQKILQRKLIETHLGGVTLQDNTPLAFVDNINEYGTEQWQTNRDLSYRNEAIEEFNSFIEENTKSNFYFIITPYKLALGTECPYGLFENYSSREDFVRILKECKFPILDMNESLPLEKEKVFYNIEDRNKYFDEGEELTEAEKAKKIAFDTLLSSLEADVRTTNFESIGLPEDRTKVLTAITEKKAEEIFRLLFKAYQVANRILDNEEEEKKGFENLYRQAEKIKGFANENKK